VPPGPSRSEVMSRRRDGIGAGRGAISLAGVVVAALLPALDDDFVDRGGESNFLDDHHDRDAAVEWRKRAIDGSGTDSNRTIIAHGLRSTGREALLRGVLRTLVDRGALVRGTREMKERNSSPTTAGSAADEETADLSG
jgi:hypothetical protein